MLSFSSAVVGAVLGALLAYLVVTAPPTSILRQVVTAVCGVLAQFGGVTLAFAWIATLGFGGLLTTSSPTPSASTRPARAGSTSCRA